MIGVLLVSRLVVKFSLLDVLLAVTACACFFAGWSLGYRQEAAKRTALEEKVKQLDSILKATRPGWP